MQTQDFQMLTSDATAFRIGDFAVNIAEPAIIASREDDPNEGTFVHPRFWQSDDTLFVNWKFDQDMLDPILPTVANGRYSKDGGHTWEKQPSNAPPGHKFATGKGEVTCYWQTYAIAGGDPGEYRMAVWRSRDGGMTWGEMQWLPITFPGTRGIDIYDPPEGYKQHSANYKNGKTQRAKAPNYIEQMYDHAGTRLRGPIFHRVHIGPDGNLRALSKIRYLPGGDAIEDDDQYWNMLDWTRCAIMMHISSDGGRTWEYQSIVAFDEAHEIIEFDEENLFTEPALVIFPDGEQVCLMRSGSQRPLYITRRSNDNESWSKPTAIAVRGIYPNLFIMHDELLVLATGRPNCTLHFSLDRGETWVGSQTLFGESREGVTPDHYTRTTNNVHVAKLDDNRLLYMHDACRPDPTASNEWLQRSGFGRVVMRRIHISPATESERAELPDESAVTRTQLPSIPTVKLQAVGQRCVQAKDWQDDAFWHEAAQHALSDVVTGGPVSQPSHFQMLSDDSHLYFHIECADSDMANLNITATQYDDVHIWDGDFVELLLRTPLHTYYQIVINPAGAVVDVDRESGIDRRWQSGIEVAISRKPSAWHVYARLALGTEDSDQGVQGCLPTTDQPWHFNVCRQRIRGRNTESSSFSTVGLSRFHELSRFAKLVDEDV